MCQHLNLVTVLLQNQTWTDCVIVCFCFAWVDVTSPIPCSFKLRLLSWVNHLLYGEEKKKLLRPLTWRLQLLRQLFLPCVVHLSRWRYGYESHFSSDLRIPHSVQCREAFEALQCSPSQQKQNPWTVYWFTHTDSKVKESWLSYSVTWRGLTFRINYRCLLW